MIARIALMLAVVTGALVTLKLNGAVAGGWAWVLAPLWAPVVVSFVGFAFEIGCFLTKTAVYDLRRKNARKISKSYRD